jgi:NAD+ kinase
MKPIRKLAFVVNEEKSGAPELASTLITVAKKSGVKYKQTKRFPVPKGYLEGFDHFLR